MHISPDTKFMGK